MCRLTLLEPNGRKWSGQRGVWALRPLKNRTHTYSNIQGRQQPTGRASTNTSAGPGAQEVISGQSAGNWWFQTVSCIKMLSDISIIPFDLFTDSEETLQRVKLQAFASIFYFNISSNICQVSIQSCKFNLCTTLEYRIKHLRISTVSIQWIKENKIVTSW